VETAARRSLASTVPIVRDDYPQVVDDFPAVVPVTQREIDVLETYLGSLLDDMLKRTH
jgi:hypothetical protein